MSALRPSSSELQRLRRLSGRRSARSGEGVFLADGPVLLAEAMAAGASVEGVYAEPDMVDDPAVVSAGSASIPVMETAPGALAKVLDLKAPRGIVAVVRADTVDASGIVAGAARSGRPVLVLVALQDPGNVGTLVRVAEATGCAGVVLTQGSVDLHNPKTVRATAGAVFRVPVAEGVETNEVLGLCGAESVRALATDGHGGEPMDRAALAGAVAVLIGSEAHGLPAEVVGACDGTISVPMEGQVESLNAAVAASVILFEAARQRRSAAAVVDESRSPGKRTGGRSAPMGHNDL